MGKEKKEKVEEEAEVNGGQLDLGSIFAQAKE